jgi:hypothetical protein
MIWLPCIYAGDGLPLAPAGRTLTFAPGILVGHRFY